MAGRYQAVKPPRFEIEQGIGGERIRIRPRRNPLALLFMPLWLIGWTAGGAAAMVELARTGEPFLVAWLCMWAVAEIAVIVVLAWMLWGAEVVGVTAGDLEIGHSLFGWSRIWLYRGREVRNLSAAESPPFFAYFYWTVPFVMKPRWGSVKFDYGGRTFYAGGGLHEAEGRMIAERLSARLPRRGEAAA